MPLTPKQDNTQKSQKPNDLKLAHAQEPESSATLTTNGDGNADSLDGMPLMTLFSQPDTQNNMAKNQ